MSQGSAATKDAGCTKGQVNGIRRAGNVVEIEGPAMVERVIEVDLKGWHQGAHQSGASLVAVQVIADAHVVEPDGYVTRIGWNINGTKTVNEEVAHAVAVADEWLQGGFMERANVLESCEGIRTGRGGDGQACGEDIAGVVVVPEGELQDDAQVADVGAGAAKPGKVAIGTQRVERQTQADRGVVLQEGLFHAEGLAVDRQRFEVAAEAAIDRLVHVVPVVEAKVDTILRRRRFVLGNLEAADGGDQNARLGSARQRRELLTSRRGERLRRNPKLVAEHDDR